MIPVLASLLGWRGIAALALAAGAAAGYVWWSSSLIEQGRAEVRAEWQADRLATAKATLRIMENNTRATQHLQAGADNTRRALRDEIRRIDAERADLDERLRNRPERPDPSGAGVPAAAGDGGACAGATGAQLYRQDGEFLAGEAARANKLRAALQSCYADYRAARASVNAVGAGKPLENALP